MTIRKILQTAGMLIIKIIFIHFVKQKVGYRNRIRFFSPLFSVMHRNNHIYTCIYIFAPRGFNTNVTFLKTGKVCLLKKTGRHGSFVLIQINAISVTGHLLQAKA